MVLLSCLGACILVVVGGRSHSLPPLSVASASATTAKRFKQVVPRRTSNNHEASKQQRAPAPVWPCSQQQAQQLRIPEARGPASGKELRARRLRYPSIAACTATAQLAITHNRIPSCVHTAHRLPSLGSYMSRTAMRGRSVLETQRRTAASPSSSLSNRRSQSGRVMEY